MRELLVQRHVGYVGAVADLGGYPHHFHQLVLEGLARLAFAAEDVELVGALVRNQQVTSLRTCLVDGNSLRGLR